MCYDLSLSNKSKEQPCIGFTQENSIEFLSIMYSTYIYCVIVCLNTNIFLFILFIFLDLIFYFILFYFYF